MTLRNALRILALLTGSAASLAVTAQTPMADYPAKPIRIIVPSSAGGPIDTNARMVGAWLQKRYGQSIVVENRPGGNVSIAMDVMIKAAGDPYTLMVAAHSVGFGHLLTKAASYDPSRDLTPIGMIGGSGYFISVPASLPVKSIAELVSYAKANPGKLNLGEAGNASPELDNLLAQLGVDVVRINYKGGGPMYAALLAGEVHIALTNGQQSANNGGKLRPLVYTDLRRHPALPAIPTVAETVMPGHQSRVWQALFGPGGLPPAIVTGLNTEMLEMVKSPDILEKIVTYGYRPIPLDVPGMRHELDAVTRKFEGFVATGVIKPQ